VSTVFDAFAASAARTPGAPFLHTEAVTARAYGIAAGDTGWAAAAAEVARLRAAFAAAGYGHGHRVGLMLENRPAFLFHWFALNALGASVVPISAEMRAAELEYLVGHSEIALAVVLPGRGADLEAAAEKAGRPLAVAELHPTIAPIATSNASASDARKPATTASPSRPLFPRAPAPAPRAAEPIDAATECALLYTSGTTGRPKGCILSNAYFLAAGRWYAGLDGVCEVRPDRERIVTPLPLNHVNAMAFSTMVVLVAGGCLVQLDRFHPQTWWQSVRASRATIVHYLGVMPPMLMSAPASPADRDHAVRWGFGAGVDKKLHAPFEARFGFPLVEAWAMTETGAAACIMANREPRHVGTSCFGRAEAFVEVRLVDDEGRDVADATPGELLVRSTGDEPRRHFFSGYLKDEAATAEAWADGWFHTGDVVRREADGSFCFVDRKKNVIRRSGENISAVEVESVLNQHPAVKASAVAAAPDEIRGDEVLACIVAREPVAEGDRSTLAASIVEHALAQLAYHKAPGYVAFVDALPLTLSQKIQRGELKAMAQALPGAAHCVDTRSLKRRQVHAGSGSSAAEANADGPDPSSSKTNAR
jgi:acyl-CoA synthetase (AMP-forming)/AMP-acid ligase II